MMYKLTDALNRIREELHINEVKEVNLNMEHKMPFIMFKSGGKRYIINILELPDV